ncbi:MAG: hypothetical protein HY901_23230, partial [Deltaproteobacteria bacterium]|nr:hypothetical protein [Deltaproteobacteria bacterium]
MATGAFRDHPRLERPFRVIAIDWEGTAVAGRKEDPGAVNALLERLLRLGVSVVVITGTNLPNTVSPLSRVIHDVGEHNRRLFLATNRGSEVYGFEGRPQPRPLFRRAASPDEERKLNSAAKAVVAELAAHAGLEVRVIHNRLNRRKIDLIPLPEWSDPLKSDLGLLLEAVQSRLFIAGLRSGLQEVLRLAEKAAADAGLRDARITSDVKHVEIGLTDKADSIEWMMREVCRPESVPAQDALVIGSEFGPIGGVEGSDRKMLTPSAREAVFVSVGPEPGGVDPQVIHLGGGPARFRELLARQIELHEGKLRPPVAPPVALPLELPREEETWTLAHAGIDLARERELESVFSVGNGYLGTRGALAEHDPLASSPATFLAGVFDALPGSQAVPELAVGPNWTRLKIIVEGRAFVLDPAGSLEHRRLLDLERGASWREWRYRDPDGRVTRMRGFRLASLADRHLAIQALELVPENWSGRLEVEVSVTPASAVVAGLPVVRPRMLFAGVSPGGAHLYSTGAREAPITLAVVSSAKLEGPGSRPVAASSSGAHDGTHIERLGVDAQLGETYLVERLVSFATSRDVARPAEEAEARLARSRTTGVSRLVQDHTAAWRERWEDCAIAIDGDPASERALRFAAYHLLIAANPEDERVSIGARTLTGESYKGHVFWDTDVFMLPFFTFTWPQAARSLLYYRFHTLEGARKKAREMGYRGALYAWESADTGEETTPRFMLAPDGEVIPILSGLHEHHISADVAYALWSYWEATRDEQFLWEAGAEILFETARFWASRGEWGDDGRLHLRNVIGPDEYHEGVDDNAFTNGMARLNLERAAEVHRVLRRDRPERLRELEQKLGLDPHEPEQWLRCASSLLLRVDPRTHLIEQFTGYYSMEAYDLSVMWAQGRRSAPMDMLLGRERTLRSRIVKQADVVMLMQLLWDRFPAEVREANFRFYEPQTCHGSSLSPATHALVAARLGHATLAAEYFKQAAEIDLANNMGNAAGGVHAAAMGGVWQAAIFGFGGVAVRDDVLRVDPRLPETWRSLRFFLRYRGARL